MLKTALLVVAGLVAGLAIAFWRQPTSEPSGGAAVADRAGPAAIGALRESPARAPRARENATNRLDAALPAFIDRGRRAAGATSERLVADLIVAGFAPDRAEWIDRRLQELRVQAAQTRHEATREGRPAPLDLEAAVLRTELGDDDYERFLIAQGRPVSIHVVRVLASSPAERVGLRRGDEIFAYDGTRVFDLRQLNELTRAGASGASVVLDVRRNGQHLRVVLPRGPLGVG